MQAEGLHIQETADCARLPVSRVAQYVLDVNRSSYYKWLVNAEARAARQRQDVVLAEDISEIHGGPGGAYGSPRATAELQENGRRATFVHFNGGRINGFS
ncbi:hypothetical protein ABZ341_35965 [Streptomyces sp. NPDC006173]|uniref:hypothetical protein n=1 Tax=Streptomyces sp. NPDC006173 TaxID=3155349 RepID=UPI0033EAB780